jgi:hypothetical protein
VHKARESRVVPRASRSESSRLMVIMLVVHVAMRSVGMRVLCRQGPYLSSCVWDAAVPTDGLMLTASGIEPLQHQIMLRYSCASALQTSIIPRQVCRSCQGTGPHSTAQAPCLTPPKPRGTNTYCLFQPIYEEVGRGNLCSIACLCR